MSSHSTCIERELDFEEPADAHILHSTPLRGHGCVQPFVFPPTLSPDLIQRRESPLTFNDLSLPTRDGSALENADGAPESDMCSLAFNDFNHSDQSRESTASSKLSLASTARPACCSSRCIASVNLLELEQIQSSFWSRNRSDQRQFLFDIVIASAKRSNCDTFTIDGYILSGKKLCQKAFVSILRISHKRLRTVTRLAMTGAITAKNTSLRTRRKTDRVEIASAWMESYFKRIGDRMPHTQQVHLPSFLSKNIVYQQMLEELAQQGLGGEKMLSLSHFYALWNDHFSYCIIPKVSLYS